MRLSRWKGLLLLARLYPLSSGNHLENRARIVERADSNATIPAPVVAR
jgi:hypothetical protein